MQHQAVAKTWTLDLREEEQECYIQESPYHSPNLSILSPILIHNNNHYQWYDVF